MAKESSESVVIFKRLLKYLQPHKKRFLVALMCMVVYGSTDGALPFLIKMILDKVFAAQEQSWLVPIAIGVVVFAIFRGVFGFCQRYLAASVGLNIVRDIRNDINQKILNLSPSFFHKHQTGSLISRITNDTLLVRMAITDAVASLLRDSIRIVALLGAAFYLDPMLCLITLVGFPICVIPIVKFGKKVRKLSRVGQDIFGGLTSILQETIVGHKVVQSFVAEKQEQDKFKAENEALTKTLCKAEKYGALSAPTNEVIASAAIGMTVLYGGYSVISGVRTQGDFIAFITAMFLLYEPVKKLSRINNTIQTGIGAAQRIFEVVDEVSDIQDAPGAKDLVLGDDFEIKYSDVSFRYTTGERANMSSEDELVLKNINLSVKKGKTLALVGSSGAGKSTLVDLLPRFYDPQEGEISIAGDDIKSLKVNSLRESIAVVGQHTFLFNDTVFNNISYSNKNATREEVINAAKAANAHDFIERLPNSYDTVIGEQGFSLSGGERQRLAIARALLKNSPILILDEATASLDSESEKLVQEAIDKLIVGRTVLVIAHRLATVRDADKLVVMSRGQVVEEGTHDELLSKGGEYSKLYQLQFRDQELAKSA